MARYTDRWGLSILGPGDSLSANGYKAVDADRRLIDRLLAYAAERHRHTGIAGTDLTPELAPTLTRLATGGVIPAGTRFYYRYTVVDEDGNESAGSPTQTIDMPAAIAAPGAPALSVVTGTGSLQPGTYSYVLSAYKAASSLETKATNSAVINIAGSSSVNSISMLLPDLPLGADGLNVYRKSPSGMHYLWIDSIAAPTNGQAWVDDGSTDGDCDRSLPAANRTSNTSAVLVSYPGATPYVPDGWSWRIYRTNRPNDWSRSYLTDITPVGVPPATPVSYTDVGSATRVGAPPTTAQVINAPSKITLTDGAEVEGTLPPGMLTMPHVVNFTWAGPVELVEGAFMWVCDYDQVDIVHCRAYLGVDSAPAVDDVIVDVNAYRPSQATPTWESIYADGPGRPRVPAGTNVGEPAVPIVRRLEAGDALCVDVDQTGGGATPTDTNLTVNIFMYVKHGSETVTYPWAI
jgi:hypothetical protein